MTKYFSRAIIHAAFCFSAICFGAESEQRIVDITATAKASLSCLTPRLALQEKRSLRQVCKDFAQHYPIEQCLESANLHKRPDRNRYLFAAIIKDEKDLVTIYLKRDPLTGKPRTDYQINAPYVVTNAVTKKSSPNTRPALPVQKFCLLDPYAVAPNEEMQQFLQSNNFPKIDENSGDYCQPTKLLAATIKRDNEKVRTLLSNHLEDIIQADPQAIRHSLLVAIQDNNAEIIKLFFNHPAIKQQINDVVGFDFYFNYARENKCTEAVAALARIKEIDAMLSYAKNDLQAYVQQPKMTPENNDVPAEEEQVSLVQSAVETTTHIVGSTYNFVTWAPTLTYRGARDWFAYNYNI